MAKEKNLNERTKEENEYVQQQIDSFEESIAKETDPKKKKSLEAERDRLVDYQRNAGQRKIDRAQNNVSNNYANTSVGANANLYGETDKESLDKIQYDMSDKDVETMANKLNENGAKDAAEVITDDLKKATVKAAGDRAANSQTVGAENLKDLSEEEIRKRMKYTSKENPLYAAYQSELQIRADLAEAQQKRKDMENKSQAENIANPKGDGGNAGNGNGAGSGSGAGNGNGTGNGNGAGDDGKKDDNTPPPPKPEDLPEDLRSFLNIELPNGQSFATYDASTGKIKLSGLPSKSEFMKSRGAKGFMSRIEGLLDVIGAAGMLFGLPPVPVGSITNDIMQNDSEEAYDTLVNQYNQIQDAFTTAIGDAAGEVVSGRGERGKDKESADDDAWLSAKTRLADAQGDWNKLEQEDLLAFNNKLAKEMAKYNNDLAKDYQSFFSGLQLNQQKELLQIMAQGEVNKMQTFMNQINPQAWGKFSKQMEAGSHYSGGFKGFMEGAKDVMGIGGKFVKSAISDKSYKKFALPKMFH